MLRTIIIAGVLAGSTSSHAEPDSHATGTWLELALDSSLALSAGGIEDVPAQHLVIGGQAANFAVGLELGIQHVTNMPWRLDLGPTARLTLLASRGRDTELVAESSMLVSLGLSDSDMSGGPTLYTFQAGLDVRHWIDRHVAVGGGVLGHVLYSSGSGASTLDLGLTGALRVSGVF